MYHIIVNPEAGRHRTLKVIEKVKKVFDSYGAKYVVHKAEHLGAAKGIAKALTKQPTGNVSFDELLLQDKLPRERAKIVVVGGDGTLHEVLNGIYDLSACEIGVIPSGTGNDFAAAAGIPENPVEASKVILEGTAKDTDFLEVGGVRCMNVAGFGIDVDVLVRYKKCKRRGKLTYLKSLIRSVFSYKGTKVVLENDGVKEEHNAFIAVACNGKQFGGGIRICPPAEIEDGKMDVVIVDFVKGLPVVGAFLKLVRGKIHTYKKTNLFRCEKVTFETEEGTPVQLDGEIYENLKFDVKLCKGLKMYR